MKRFLTILKGFIIGSSMAVPGVSGGTMAIVLGIYDKLLSAINGLRKNFKDNAIFLVKFGSGAAVGLVLFYELIGKLLNSFPIPVSCLFFGAVIGGIPTLWQKIKPAKATASFCVTSLLWGLLGAAIVLCIGNIPQVSLIAFSSDFSLTNVLIWMMTGLIISIALILPGISTSHMLIILGITSILSIPLHALAVIGISLLLGIFLITKPLEWAMNRFTCPTYCLILGFVIGSLGDIFAEKIIPNITTAATPWWQWLLTIVVSLIAFVGGLIGLLQLSRFSED